MNKRQPARLLNLCFIILSLLLSLYPATSTLAQANLIAVEPGSGTPGTTLTIRDSSGTNTGKNCFVTPGSGRAQSIGVMQGALSYIVPSDLAAGTTISFICTGGADGLRTNTATFTVTALAIIVQPPAQPSDVDGDGLPDTRDNCPNEAGPLDNNGCPLSAPPVADSDADGLPDNVDSCPNEAGVQENNGCPLVVATLVPAVVLPPLPTDGPCVIATLDAAPVNVREFPTTDAAIVGSLDPASVYAVIARNVEGSWYQIDGGWVAGFVSRQGGNCTDEASLGGPKILLCQGKICTELDAPEGAIDDLTAGDSQPAIGLLVPAVQKVREAAARMSNCPDLLPTVDGLPTFLTLYIIGEPDPCAAAQAELDGLFLTAANNPMTLVEDEYYELVNNYCPDLLGDVYDFTYLLYTVQERSQEAWQDISSRITGDNICAVIQPFAEQRYLSGIAFQDGVINLTAVAYCTAEAYNTLTPGWVSRIEGYIDFLQVPTEYMRTLFEGDIFPTGCRIARGVQPIGVINSGNAIFYNTLVNSCGVDPSDAVERALLDSVSGAYNAEAAANLGCAGYDQYTGIPLPADLQPTLPQIAQDATCQRSFRLLASHNGGLSPETLFRILTALDPCASTEAYAYYGGIHANQLPLPPCFQNGQVIIPAPSQGQDDVVLTSESTWRQKLLILDRPLDQICNYFDLSVGSDGFALVPTEDALDLVIVASATPLGLVAEPTVTLPAIVADQGLLPTSPPLLDSSPTPPVPTVQPADPLPAVNPVPGDQTGGTGYQIISAGRINEPLTATFLAYDAQGNFAGRYLLTSVRHRSFSIMDRTQLLELPPDCCAGIRTDLPVSIQPGGEAFAYFADDPATGTVNLWVYGVEIPAEQQKIPLGNWVADVTYELAWSPDGQFIAISAANGTADAPLEGHQTLVFYLGGIPAPVLTIENAAAPSISPNGRLLAFERMDATGRSIYVRAMNSGEITPITQQAAGSECFDPQFGLDSLTLFFTCESNGERGIFRYGLAGLTPLQTGIANAQNPSPGPEPGYITFDDGQTLYISRDDGTNAAPLVRIDGLSVRGLQWTQPPGSSDSIWIDLSAPIQ